MAKHRRRQTGHAPAGGSRAHTAPLRIVVCAIVVTSATMLLLLLLVADPRTVRHERAVLVGGSARAASVAVGVETVETEPGRDPIIIDLPIFDSPSDGPLDPRRPMPLGSTGSDPAPAELAAPVAQSQAPTPSALTQSAVVVESAAATVDDRQEESIADIVERTRSGVVRIETVRCVGGRQGTAFMIGSDLLATAAHVVADAEIVMVRNSTSDALAVVIGYDDNTDLALLRITSSPSKRDNGSRYVFAMGAGEPDRGESVVALGYPRGEDLTATAGDIVAVHRNAIIGAPSRQDYLETNAELVPGNSGGPVLDRSGNVVGLAVSVLADDKSTSFAVVGHDAWEQFRRWAEEPSPPPVPSC